MGESTNPRGKFRFDRVYGWSFAGYHHLGRRTAGLSRWMMPWD